MPQELRDLPDAEILERVLQGATRLPRLPTDAGRVEDVVGDVAVLSDIFVSAQSSLRILEQKTYLYTFDCRPYIFHSGGLSSPSGDTVGIRISFGEERAYQQVVLQRCHLS